MAKITEVRLTLAALIYGVEIDLKNTIKKSICPFYSDISFFQDSDLEQRTILRFKKDNPDLDYLKSIDEVIEYIDFGDTFTILSKNDSFLKPESKQYLKDIFSKLVAIIPIRNRVMHTRPLLGGDFAMVYDFVSQLKTSDPIDWNISLETRFKIEKDPLYVLTLSLPPSVKDESLSTIIHNLPVPDFDETGFIGRTKDVEDVKQLIFSNKVVSLIGDGGIGKTALALKVAYDIVDLNEKSPFELVIWTTAKTTMLTTKGIEEIYTAITDYTGLINVLSDKLQIGPEERKIDSILEYLDLFKTLIVLDNLETIHSEEIRDFIRIAQTKCHILITSRIGLGELEFPRKLNGLSEAESAKLIREIAKIRNSDALMKLPNKNLVEISEKLYFNPLALKWFVSTVEMGIAPHEVLNNKEDLLNFCLTNVYDKLSSGAIEILNTIRASRRRLTTGELIYLSDFEPLDVRKHLIELFKTTLVNRDIKDVNNLEEVYYYISEFAKDFLSRRYQIPPEYVVKISRKYKLLEEGLKDISKFQKYNEFTVNALSFETANQKIAAKFLSEALSFSKSDRFDQALQKVNEAKNIDPNYSEVYRVSAFIKATQGDILEAEEDYKLGLEIAPDNVRLLFYYAQFLLFSIEDEDSAFDFAKKVYELKPNHPYTAFLFARCHAKKGDYSKTIQIVKDLLQNDGLDPKNRRVAFTELISAYSQIGYNLFKVETDISNGISHYKKAFSTFEESISENALDYKVIKHFADSLHMFINQIPPTEINTQYQFVKDLITKHKDRIRVVHNSDKLFLKFKDKFNDDAFDTLLEEHLSGINQVGNVIQKKEDLGFAFIDSNNNQYFAHKNDFIDVTDWVEWKKIKEGDLVTFEIGTNPKGECAKNIKICI